MVRGHRGVAHVVSRGRLLPLATARSLLGGRCRARWRPAPPRPRGAAPGDRPPAGLPACPPASSGLGWAAMRSLWLEEALARDGEDDVPPLHGDERADVCVVGGGYAGLWTA